MCHLFWNGSYYVNSILNNSAPSVKAGSNFTVNHSNQNIFYIGTDSQIYRIYYSGGWQYDNVTQAGYCQEGARNSILYNDSKIYYTGLDGNIHEFEYVPTSAKKGASVNVIEERTPEESTEGSTQLSIYPNPISPNDELYIEIPTVETDGKIIIYDIRGRAVLEVSPESTINIVRTDNLPYGLYIVIYSDQTKTLEGKLQIL